jgi:ribosome biogenesis GTPase
MKGQRPPAAASQPAPATAQGVVIASYRRHFAVLLDGGEAIDCVLRGRSLALACGDRVAVARVPGGGAIESVAPRTTLFYRSDAMREKLIAANVSQVVAVVAPDLSIDEELLNRWCIAAEAQQCRFVLAANKADKPGFDRLLQRLAPFAALGYPIVELAAKKDASALRPWVMQQHSVLIGQSGMGKSTILNALAPAAQARTAEVSAALSAGRHTTTHSTLYPLGAALADGWLVDSPGMKQFGLAHVAPDTVPSAFVEFRDDLGHCRFRDCRHDREPDCALRARVDAGAAAPHRLALLRTLVRESESAATAVRGPSSRA